MHTNGRHIRQILLAMGVAASLVACGADAPDLPEAPPDQDGTVEQPVPTDAAEEIEIEPDELQTE